jgi:hypothetical protein
VFGSGSPELQDFQYFNIDKGGSFVGGSDGEYQSCFLAGIPDAVALLEGLANRLRERKTDAASAPQPSKPTASPNPLNTLRQVLMRFHLAVRQLRDRHDARPTLDVSDEYDVQDLLHALLRMFFDDIRPEEYSPSYAGKASRMDFLLKNERIVVEAKMTRAGLGAKEVGAQLIEDIARYSVHPDCGRLICFVYDPTERINNPRGLERDLGGSRGQMEVEVMVVPRGG